MGDTDPLADGRHDFDFIFGRWRIGNRRLLDQTDPQCTQWIEFATEAEANPIFDGLAHLDLIRAVGDFLGDDVVAGRAIKLRFEWVNPSPDTARWTSRSPSTRGRTWRPNWIMSLTRRG
jgi:hypothetical protein